MSFRDELTQLLDELGHFLTQKNDKYGDSALTPVRIFSKADVFEQLRVRLDDKLSRIARGDPEEEDEDVILDICGYLVLWMLQEKREGIR